MLVHLYHYGPDNKIYKNLQKAPRIDKQMLTK